MPFPKGLFYLVQLALFLGQGPSSGEAASLPTRADNSRTVAPANCIVVKPSGASASEFTSLQAAVNSIGSSTKPACIFLNSGTYNERVEIKVKAPLTLYGSTTDTGSYKKNTVIIQNTLGSQDAGSLDASSTVNLRSNDFAAYNIDFVNGYTAGQAVALTANGNKTGFYGCSFKSYQDTLYVKAGWMYYSNCYIEGAVDYIFGNGHAWIGEYHIYRHPRSDQQSLPRTSLESQRTSDVPVQHSDKCCETRGLLTYGRRRNTFENTGAGADTSQRKYFTASDKALTKQDLWGADFKWYDASY
ncbi:Putative pectinesterase A [Fusarium oxysporum f. sp. cubense race 1]|uniref:Pectinesterase n=1 Tax=Fusarium oxysporum f. sp. cubense (strain race 1) TaxID=1229664 RepID=N4UB39_FUSC1|nr:Putative pectinesterase A [Fusarium oxysporum f. sp. cubense race 1]